jgi:hypothetical protein
MIMFNQGQTVIYHRQNWATDFLGLSATVTAIIVAPRFDRWNRKMYEICWQPKGWAIVYEEKLEEI